MSKVKAKMRTPHLPVPISRRMWCCNASMAAATWGWGIPAASIVGDAMGQASLDGAGRSSGPWRRLFLDAAATEGYEGLSRRFQVAEKHPAPLLVADQPWEGKSAIIGPYVYGTVLREEGRYRMWYQQLYQGNHIGYAESDDALHWRKPKLDVFEYQGEKTNLVVSDFDRARTGGSCHNPSVILNPNAVQAERRYVLLGFDGKAGHPRAAYSPDGIHWTYPPATEKVPLFASSDVVNFDYDPYLRRYYGTWKTKNRRGRAVGVVWSDDGENWIKPYDGPVFVADDLDPDDTQIYGMPVFPYQGMYIGLPWIYRARYFRYGEYQVDRMLEAQQDSPRSMDVQLAWSWDQINWTRPPSRTPLIERGGQEGWDRGMIVTARAPIVVGDKLYFYYGGTDRGHDEKQLRAGIGVASLRLDGFCSLATDDRNEGWVITRREPLREPVVSINARTWGDGLLRGEILDRNNRVVPGFSRDECLPFAGDAVAHSLRWTTVALPKAGPLTDYKIKFWLRRGELFSYLPSVVEQ